MAKFNDLVYRNAKNSLVSVIKEYVTFDSYKWIQDVLQKLNKAFLTSDNIKVDIASYTLYSAFEHYITNVMTDKSEINIILTIYIVGIQTGILELGNPIEQSSVFTDNIDMEDWQNITIDSLNMFDLRSNAIYVKHHYEKNKSLELGACGLMTLNTIRMVEGVSLNV